jgi:hypothetical protein
VYVNSLYKNPFEHSRGDVIDNIDFEMLEKVSRGMLALVANLAGANSGSPERQTAGSPHSQERG